MTEKSYEALGVLKIAEEQERSGQAFYQEAAQAVPDENVRALLLTLADAEARHLQAIEEMRRGLQKAFPTFSHEDDVSDLASRFRTVLFPESLAANLPTTGELDEIQVLERARRLEEDSIKLYEEAAEKEGNPGASNVFRRLVMDERVHLYIVNRRLDLLKLRHQGA